MIKEYTSVNTIMESWQQDEKVFIRYFFFEKQPIENGSHEMYRIFQKYLLFCKLNFERKKKNYSSYNEKIHLYWHLIPIKSTYYLIQLLLFNFPLKTDHLFLHHLLLMMIPHRLHRFVQLILIQSKLFHRQFGFLNPVL